jgi:two-component system response regulator FlrC
MQAHARILLVDDETLVRRSLQKTLVRAGFQVEAAGGCPEGLAAFQAAAAAGAPFDLAVLDLNMPGFEGGSAPGAGLELLSRLVEARPALPVVMLTAYDEVGKAREAIQRGARSYFVKGREQGLVELILEILNA